MQQGLYRRPSSRTSSDTRGHPFQFMCPYSGMDACVSIYAPMKQSVLTSI